MLDSRVPRNFTGRHTAVTVCWSRENSQTLHSASQMDNARHEATYVRTVVIVTPLVASRAPALPLNPAAGSSLSGLRYIIVWRRPTAMITT